MFTTGYFMLLIFSMFILLSFEILAFDSFPVKEFQFLTSEHFSKNNNATKDNTNKSTEMSSGQTYSKPQQTFVDQNTNATITKMQSSPSPFTIAGD